MSRSARVSKGLGVIAFLSLFMLGSCDNDIKLDKFLQNTGTSYKVVTAFGELVQTSPERVAHYIEVKVDPPDTPVFAPTGGEIVFNNDLDGLQACVVIKPTLRDDDNADEFTQLNDLGPGLADADEIRVALCGLDNSGSPSPLHAAIEELYTKAEDPDPADKTIRFFNTSLAPKDRRGNVWAAPDAEFPDPPAGSEKKPWSILGPAVGGELRIAVFRMKDDHPIYLNPAPYLARIPLSPTPAALRQPTIAEIKIETATNADFTTGLKMHDVNLLTGVLTPNDPLENYVRVFFRLADTGSMPVVAPQEISYALSQKIGAGAAVRSHAQFYPNSLFTSDVVVLDTSSQGTADDLYRVTGAVGTTSSPTTDVLWMQLPFDPQPYDESEPVPKYDIGDTVEPEFLDVDAIHDGSPRFPAGDYELDIVLASGFVTATSDSRTVVFKLAGPGSVEFVSDAANDHTIDHTDPVIDHAQVGHWGADSGAGVDGYDGAGSVRNSAPPDNFIDKDPERFYLRIADATKNTDSSVRETITAKIGTATSAGAIDDDLTNLQLTETTSGSGIFVSKAQLLMSPDLPFETFTDSNSNCIRDAGEAFADADGDGAHNTDNPDDDLAAHDGFSSTVCDDVAGDRTHRVTVDGIVRVEYGSTPASQSTTELSVCDRDPEERMKLNVQVTIFNEPWNDVGFDHDSNPATALFGSGDGVFNFTDTNGNTRHDSGESSEPFNDISGDGDRGQIWTNDQVNRSMNYTSAYLASACIRVVELPRIVTDPTGTLFLHTPGFFDDFSDDGTGATPSRDEAIIQASFRSAVNLNVSAADDIVDMYFVAPFTVAGSAYASQFRPGFVGTSGLAPALINQVHIGLNTAADNVAFAAAHELMHQLMNQPDSATPNHIFFPMSGAVVGDGTTWLTKRRMTAAAAGICRTTRGATMAAVGNNLLRSP